jgi:tetratricopeptide (TPR) repeat protein
MNPDDPDTLNDLGVRLAQGGRWQEAAGIIARVIALRPKDPIAYNNLGVVLQQLGHIHPALRVFDRALQLKPAYAAAHGNRGHALMLLGRAPEALGSYEAALACDPLSAEGHYNRAAALCTIGRLEEAVASYRRALAQKPDYMEACNNLAIALSALERHDQALAYYERAVALKPTAYEGHNNLGLALLGLGRLQEALRSFDRGLALGPKHPQLHNGRGIALHGLHLYRQAMESYETANTLDPNFADAKWNRGLLLLALGRMPEGWALAEARFQVASPIVRTRACDKPLWLGEPVLSGRTLLLHAAEGFGDTLQYCRYAPLAKSLGARVILEVQPGLKRLLGSLQGVDHIVEPGKLDESYDFHCPMLSLPLAFRSTLVSLPRETAYLGADPDGVSHWADRLGTAPELRVGIAWQGNPKAERNLACGRSIPLAYYSGLAAVPGVRLISLQKGDGASQLESVDFGDQVWDFAAELDTGPDAFVDTAALMKNLDVVITSDTSIAHLAGALGVPVWVALHFTPDWRWMIERSDSPWYPSMRLFRQPAPGNWQAVIEELARELQQTLAARTN